MATTWTPSSFDFGVARIHLTKLVHCHFGEFERSFVSICNFGRFVGSTFLINDFDVVSLTIFRETQSYSLTSATLDWQRMSNVYTKISCELKMPFHTVRLHSVVRSFSIWFEMFGLSISNFSFFFSSIWLFGQSKSQSCNWQNKTIKKWPQSNWHLH